MREMDRDEVAFPSKFRGEVLGAACVGKVLQVSKQKSIHAGFHTEVGGGGLEFPPPPRNLEIQYGYYCGAINIRCFIYMLLDIRMCHQSVVWKVCPRLRQKQS